MKTVFVDIMLDDKFVKTLPYKYNPMFHVDMDELHEYVIGKLPFLKNKDFKMYLDYGANDDKENKRRYKKPRR